MKIDRLEFLTLIKSLTPGIDLKSDATNKIYFDSDVIYTNTNDIQVKINYQTDMQCCIYATKIIVILQKLKDDEIDLELKDSQLVITGEKTEFILPSVEVNNKLDFDSQLDIDNFRKVSPTFFDDLKLASFSIDSDHGAFPMNCAFISNKKIYTTDNYRATIIKTRYSGDAFLMPYTIIQEIMKYTMTHIKVTENYIHFYDEKNGIQFLYRNVYGSQFPDIESLFIESEDQVHITFPKNFTFTIERIATMSDDENNSVHVSAKSGKIIVNSKSVHGKAKETIDCPEIKTNVVFKINARFLIEILKLTDTAVIGNNILLFHTDNFNHVIALIEE